MSIPIGAVLTELFRTGNAMERMTAFLDSLVEKNIAAGVSALVKQRGKELYFHASGYSDIENKKLFSRETPVYIYSMSKLITAATVLVLCDKGYISLSDDIAEYIPEFRNPSISVCDSLDKPFLIPSPTPVTIRHLLTMTSGIPYPSKGGNAANRQVFKAYREINKKLAEAENGDNPYTALDYAKKIASCPLCFAPGKTWLYGLGSDVLGGIIEAVTGMNLNDYMSEVIFRPLGMKHTGFIPTVEDTLYMGKIYTPGTDKPLVPWKDEGDFKMTGNRSLCSGGGGLYSTADDYMLFAEMLLSSGGNILKPETAAMMTSDSLSSGQKRGFNWLSEFGNSYGLSVRIVQKPELSSYTDNIGSFGWDGMAGTTVRISPSRDSAAVFFIQRVPSDIALYLPEFSRRWQDILDQQ